MEKLSIIEKCKTMFPIKFINFNNFYFQLSCGYLKKCFMHINSTHMSMHTSFFLDANLTMSLLFTILELHPFLNIINKIYPKYF